MNLIAELKRRNVFRVAILYAVFSWLILQVADVLFGIARLPDFSLTLVAIILALGFVPALVFSWIYELTPEGVKREKDIDRSQSVTHHTARKLDVTVIVLLVATIATVAVDRLFLPDADEEKGNGVSVDFQAPEESPSVSEEEIDTDPISSPTEEASPSVAVLPFVNMSPDPNQEFFSDGLSDTLIHVLTQIQGLKVAARTSSFAFKGRQVDVREIADTLGVANVLEGSVQKAGDRLRIIAQLIDASDGTHLWSTTFDRSADDIFAIQDEIASEVVKALKGALLEEETAQIAARYEPSLEAYQAFLKGRQEMAKRTSEALAAAEAHFKAALEQDPDYPLALVNLGDVYNLQTYYAGRSRDEYLALSEPLYRRALELAPLMGEVHTSLGNWYANQNKNDQAIPAYEQGIELNPGYSTAYHWYGLVLGDLGEIEKALEMFVRASELDPLSDVIRHNLIGYLNVNGRKEEAEAMAVEAVRRNPDYTGYYGLRGGFYLDRGDLARYVYWQREAARRDPGNVLDQVWACWSQFAFPDLASVRPCVDRLLEEHPENEFVLSMHMRWLTHQGEVDRAIDLGRALAESADPSRGGLPLGILTGAYRLADQDEQAMALILARSPDLDPGNEGGQVTASNWDDALALAEIWRSIGEPERSRHLATQVLAEVEGRNRFGPGGMGISDVGALLLLDRDDEAMARLESAVEGGWVIGWRWHFLHNPIFAALRDRKDFQVLARELTTRLAEQQAWLEAQPPLHERIEAGEWEAI